MSKPVQIAIIVVCLGAAAYLIFTNVNQPSTESPKAVYHYECINDRCKHEWSWVAGDPLPGGVDHVEMCPQCQTEYAQQSAKCDACGKLHPIVGHGGSQKECPHCGASMID